MAANYPFSWFNLSDGAVGELNAGIDASQSSFVLKSGQGIKFPASDFIVHVEAEDIHVATRTTDTCSGLTRQYGNTSPAPHAANTVVFQSAGKNLFQRIIDNLIGHTHPKADIPDFAHNHAQGDITNLVGDLAGKAASSHTHAESDVTNLTTDLAAKETTANKGAANGYAGLGANSRVPTAQLGSGTPDATTFLRGDQTYAAPAGGSDPWTYVRLASDFTTTSATAVDVTGMSLTPAANLRYQIEGLFLLRTATATVGPRPGCAWPTGMTDGVAMIDMTSAAGTRVLQNGNINAAVLAPVGGLPNTTQSWPASIYTTLLAGATPSGTFRIQLASETAGTTVTMKAGSWFRWRTF